MDMLMPKETLRKDAQRPARPRPQLHPRAARRALFDRAPSGTIQFGLDGALLRVNPACATLIAYAPQELASRTIIELTCATDLPLGMAQLQRLLDNAAEAVMAEKRLVRHDRLMVWGRCLSPLCAIRRANQHMLSASSMISLNANGSNN
jgi:PAS domain S-box-containing protein